MKEKSLKERLHEGITCGLITEKAIVKLIGALFERKQAITENDILASINGYTDNKFAGWYDDWYTNKPEAVSYAYNVGNSVASTEKELERN